MQTEQDEFVNNIAQDISENPPQTIGEQQVVDGLAKSEQAGRIKASSEVYNLAADMDDKILKEIGNIVFEGFDRDNRSRSEWLEMHTYWLRLYMQQDYAINADSQRDWGATESMPILTEACDQFQSRTYKIFFPNDTFVSAVPMNRSVEGRDILEDRANRIARHMSYQLGFVDRTYKQDKDALFLGVAVHGSFFTKTYFSPQLKRFKVDNVRPTDLVVQASLGPIRIEDVRRKTHIIYSTVAETEELKKSGYFIDSAKPGELSRDNEYNLTVREIEGINIDGYNVKQDAPVILLEQHGYLDINDSGDYFPYITTICAQSRKVLRISIGWEADEAGNPLDDYKQIQYFTHYKYKENPDSFYGLGLGHTIGDLNAAVNVMLRQALDAATLANDGNMSGFISERLGLEGDEISLTIGKFTKIPDTVGDMNQSMMMMKFPGPNSAHITLMSELDQRAQRMASTTEATTGGSDKVVQPTTYLAQIEQALEQFSSVQMRLSYSLTDELQKIFRINQKYMPFIDYFTINGVPNQITRNDYQADMLIKPIFDPKYATQSQKVARAKAELEATLQNPVNQSRPQVYDEAFKRYFKALEVENIAALLPPQPEIQNFDDQYIENMFFLQPKESRPLFDVFPDQNHAQHLAILHDFIAQYGGMLQPDQQEDILKHKQKHEGYLYGQQHGLIPPTGATQIPTPPMVGSGGNEMGDGAPQETIPQTSSFGGGFDMGGTA